MNKGMPLLSLRDGAKTINDLIAKENEYCRFQQLFKTVKNAKSP